MCPQGHPAPAPPGPTADIALHSLPSLQHPHPSIRAATHCVAPPGTRLIHRYVMCWFAGRPASRVLRCALMYTLQPPQRQPRPPSIIALQVVWHVGGRARSHGHSLRKQVLCTALAGLPLGYTERLPPAISLPAALQPCTAWGAVALPSTPAKS